MGKDLKLALVGKGVDGGMKGSRGYSGARESQREQEWNGVWKGDIEDRLCVQKIKGGIIGVVTSGAGSKGSSYSSGCHL
jgi:hypothetical protein